MKNKIKILAPAGTYDAFLAAVQNGADEIYLGGQQFGARAYANNFTNEELIEIVKYAHIRGVSIYVTVNTLILEEELQSVFTFVDFLYKNDVDGIIVQDLGLLHYVNKHYPDFKIIASTQMNVHNLAGARVLKNLGISRIVVAREMDVATIAQIKQELNLEIEAFCHGALCVSYSGQCLISSFIGKRSGNRGKCAQPCRLSYQMEKDGVLMNQAAPLLSTKELMTLDQIHTLIEAGIDSLKIEGRMKGSEYVALTTSLYKKAVDNYYASGNSQVSEAEVKELAKAFNRQFTPGYILNMPDFEVVNIESSNHQGIRIGKVVDYFRNQVMIELEEDVALGDGLRFVEKDHESGIMLNQFYKNGYLVKNALKGEVIEFQVNEPITIGAIVLKTLDAKQKEDMQKTYAKEFRKVDLKVSFMAKKGQPFTLVMSDQEHSVRHISEYIVEKAINAPMDEMAIVERLNKLGNTPYQIVSFISECDQDIMIPVRFINEAKNILIEEISQLRMKRYIRKGPVEYVEKLTPSLYSKPARLSAKVHSVAQLEAIVNLGLKRIYLEDLSRLGEAKERYPNENILGAYPRIHHDYQNIYSEALIAELGGLDMHANSLTSDAYMNVINSYGLAFLIKSQVETVTLALESSLENTKNIIHSFQQRYRFMPNLAHVVYGYMDAMLLKYCPIAKVNGIKVKHCDECRRHTYKLVDRLDYRFSFLTNDDCTVRLLNSKRTVLWNELEVLSNLGIQEFRLDFTIEQPEVVTTITKAFIQKMQDKNYPYSFNDATFGHLYEKI